MRPGAKPDLKTGYAPADFDWSRPIPGGPRDRGFDYYFGSGFAPGRMTLLQSQPRCHLPMQAVR